MAKKEASKVDKIVERGKKRIDKFYKSKQKNEYTKSPAYLKEARIDNCLKSF